jgi:hypothetical protein
MARNFYDTPEDVTNIPMVNTATNTTTTPTPTTNPTTTRRPMGSFGSTLPGAAMPGWVPNAATRPRPLPAPTALPGPGVQPVTGSAAPNTGPIAPTPQTTSGPGTGVGLIPTNPNNPLTGQTIVPGATADRMAVAQQRWDQYAASTAPAYQAALQQANRYGAAQGRLNSGSLRTDFGNLANQRNTQLDLARQGFLTDATDKSIEDAWRAINLAQQQQGFQNQQQNQAWGQGLDLFGMGNTNNPTAARQYAAGTYGQGAGQAAYDFWRTLGQGVPGQTQYPPAGGG